MDNIAAKPGVFLANRMLPQQHHHNHQHAQLPHHQRHLAAGPSSAVLMGGQQQTAGLYNHNSSNSSGANSAMVDYFKCPQCNYLTLHSDEIETHFRDVHLPNFSGTRHQQHQPQQYSINGLKPINTNHNRNNNNNNNNNNLNRPSQAGRQKLVGGSANFASLANQNYSLSSSLADVDESAVAAAKTILSISASTSSMKTRRHQSIATTGATTRNDMGNVINHGGNTNANIYVNGAAYAKSIDNLRQIQQQQHQHHNQHQQNHQLQQPLVQHRTSYVADDSGVSNDCMTAAMMDPNFRPRFYSMNVNNTQHVNQLQANNASVGLGQHHAVNQLSPAQQQTQQIISLDSLAAAVEAQNLLLRNFKAPPPGAGAGGALSPVLNTADLMAYRQQLWMNIMAAATANNAAAASSPFNALQQLAAAHQLLTNNAAAASQLLGGAGGVAAPAAHSPATTGGVNVGVGAYLPLRGNDNATAAAHHQQHSAAVAAAGRQNFDVGVGRQNAAGAPPQISPLVATSVATAPQASPRGRHVATENVVPPSSMHGVVRRHSMLPAINATRVRMETLTSPSARSAGASVGQPSLSLRSAAEVEQHITRLISQNEAILEPSPILAKRRTYTRQLNQPPQQSGGSTGGHFQQQSPPPLSGSPPLPREYRSNSLYSSFSPATSLIPAPRQQQNVASAARQSRGFVGAVGPTVMATAPTLAKASSAATIPAPSAYDDDDALTSESTLSAHSAAPSADDAAATLRFLAQVENATLRATEKLFTCKFCRLSVRQADDLGRHEQKCARRGFVVGGTAVGVDDKSFTPEGGSAVIVAAGGSSKGPLKKRLLAAAEHDATMQSAEMAKVDSVDPLQPSTHMTKRRSLPTATLPPAPTVHPQHFVQQQRQPPSLLLPALQPYTLTCGYKHHPSTSPSLLAGDAQILNRKPALTMVTDCFANATRRRMHHALTSSWTATPSVLSAVGGHADNPAAASKRFRGDCFSLYADWSQLPVCPKETMRNLMLMSACTLRVHYSPLCYSMARSSGSDMHVTHSTYWLYAQLIRSLAAQRLQTAEQERGASRLAASVVDATTAGDGAPAHSAPTPPPAPSVDAEVDESAPLTDVVVDNRQERPIADYSNRRRRIFRRNVWTRRRRARLLSRRDSLLESQKAPSAAVDADSDETMSNDGLCVVTDEEDEVCNKFGQTLNNSGLLTELRQKLDTFGENWERLMKSDVDGYCISPFVVDRFKDSDWPSSPPHYRCPSAPPAPIDGRLAYDGSCGFADQLNAHESSNPNSSVVCDLSSQDRTFSAFKRPCKSASSKATNADSATNAHCGTDELNVEEENAVGDSANDDDSMRKITPVWTGESSTNVCETCGKRFTNISHYSLHLDGHSIERPSKRYDCKCSYCTTVCRSRSSLQKHMATAHPQIASQKQQHCATTDDDHTGAKEALSPGGALSPPDKTHHNPALSSSKVQQILPEPDPRPFKCLYCYDTLGRKVAFRIHGHLAKHLRSKSHIMKMESLDVVPPGTFSTLEASKSDKFLQIDTSDCEHSLESLLKIVEEMQLNEKCADQSSNKMPQTLNNASNAANIPPTSPFKNGALPVEKSHLLPQQLDERGTTVPSASVNVPSNFPSVRSISTVSTSVSGAVPPAHETVPSTLDTVSPPRYVAPVPSNFAAVVWSSKHAAVPSLLFGTVPSKSGCITSNMVIAQSIYGTVPSHFRTVPSSSVTVPYPATVSSLICTEMFQAISPPAVDDESSPKRSLTSMTSSATIFGSKKVAADLWVPPKEIPRTASADSPTFSSRLAPGPASDDFQPTSDVTNRPDATKNDLLDCPKEDTALAGTVLTCTFCPGAIFSSARDLDVHYHADHVLMRDGSFFKCPKANCDTLYPTRKNLRDHLTSHFHGSSYGGGSANGSGHGLVGNGSGSATGTTDSDTSHGSRTDSLNNRHTVAAALNRKLAILTGDVYGSTLTKKSYCRRTSLSSSRSLCDCSKCSKGTDNVSRPGRSSVPEAVGSNSPLPPPWTPLSDSDASRLSIASAGGNDDASSTTPPLSNTAVVRSHGGYFLQASPTIHVALMPSAARDETPLIISQRSSLTLNADRRSSSNDATVTPGRPNIVSQRSSSMKRQATTVAGDHSVDVDVKRGRFAAPVINGEASSPLTFDGDDDVDVDVELEDDDESSTERRQAMNHRETADGATSFLALHNLRCIACGDQFYSVLELQRHIVFAHSSAAPQRPSERAFLCAYCDAAFTNERALKAHAPCRPQLLATAAKRRQRRRRRDGGGGETAETCLPE